MLYADGREADAAAVLYRTLDPGQIDANNLELWEMLFDLLRARGQWTRYEQLAARFEQVFGSAAPQWLNEAEIARLPAELRPGAPGYFEFAGRLDGSRNADIQRVRDAARNLASVHVDLSRLSELDEQGCAAFAQLLRFLPSNGNGVLVTGGDHLGEMLHGVAESNPAVGAFWALLLELYRVRGMQTEFERTALEYALAMGASPPAWQPTMTPLAANTSPQEKRDQPRYQIGPEIVSVTGMMWGAADPQLAEVRAFAEDREYINIDLSQLKRMDFSCGSAFASLVNELNATGRVVRLLRPNSLVAAFLATLNLDSGITLVRARPPV